MAFFIFWFMYLDTPYSRVASLDDEVYVVHIDYFTLIRQESGPGQGISRIRISKQPLNWPS